MKTVTPTTPNICDTCKHEHNETCTASEKDVIRNETSSIVLCTDYIPEDNGVQLYEISFGKIVLILLIVLSVSFLFWFLFMSYLNAK